MSTIKLSLHQVKLAQNRLGITSEPPKILHSVDVLMTVFNGESHITDTLDSVISQTYPNWRLIVVDDGSTDSTPNILSDYALKDSRVLILKGEHRGIAAAANIGLLHVRAPLLARMDADDIASPERLQIQREFMLKNPAVVAVGSYAGLIDSKNRRLGVRKVPTNPKEIKDTLRIRNCMCHPSTMIRTDAIRSIGGYRPKFHNSLDYDLWLRLSEIGEISNIDRELLLYRRHSGQVSSPNNSHRQTAYSVAAAIDHFYRYYGRPDRQSVIEESNNDSLGLCLQEIYSFDLSPADRKAINRHSMRLLRRSKTLSDSVRNSLSNSMLPNLSFAERLKHRVYQTLLTR